MIVVATSAVFASLRGEPERHRVNVSLDQSASSIMSAANYLECSIVLAARFGDDAVYDLRLFVHEAQIDIVAVDRDQGDLAHEAWKMYGKGRHPASLNFGDCFAYALASQRGAPLLFVGEDFAQTDIEPA